MIYQITTDIQNHRTRLGTGPESRDDPRYGCSPDHSKKACSRLSIALLSNTVYPSVGSGSGAVPPGSDTFRKRIESGTLLQPSAAYVAVLAVSPGLADHVLPDKLCAACVTETFADCERTAAPLIIVPRRAHGERGTVLRSWLAHQSLLRDRDRAL